MTPGVTTMGTMSLRGIGYPSSSNFGSFLSQHDEVRMVWSEALTASWIGLRRIGHRSGRRVERGLDWIRAQAVEGPCRQVHEDTRNDEIQKVDGGPDASALLEPDGVRLPSLPIYANPVVLIALQLHRRRRFSDRASIDFHAGAGRI